MQCPECQREPLDGAIFCNNCGAQLQVRCHSCSVLNPVGSRFCHGCGTEFGVRSSRPEGREASSEAGASRSSAVCPRCRRTNEPGSLYCYECGLPLEGVRAFRPTAAVGEAGDEIVELAGFWVRLVAYVLDGLILLVVALLVAAAAGADAFSDAASEQLTWTDAVSFLLDALYFTVAVAVWSTTIGKRLFRLYVVRSDGSRVGAGRALARYLSYFLSALILLIGFIMIGVRRDKRGLHDLICDTRVVRR